MATRYIACRAVFPDGSNLRLSDVEWQANRFSRAATFAFTAPVSADAVLQVSSILAAGGRLSLEVMVGTSPASAIWTKVFVGQADRVGWDPLSRVMICEGRDLAAILIGYRVNDGYLNQTSSDIATSLAQACGLTAQVTQTYRMVGQYYQIEHRRASFLRYSGRTTAWDMLTELAVIEGFRAYVDKETLVFEPVDTGSRLLDTWSLVGEGWSSARGLGLEHVEFGMLPEIGNAPEVRVRSWNSRQRMLVDTAPEALGRVYDVVRPNMPDEDANRLAKSLLQRVATQAYSMQVRLPGELDLAPGRLVRTAGSGTAWDRVYRIDNIERSISVASGFRQVMSASAFSGGQGDAESA